MLISVSLKFQLNKYKEFDHLKRLKNISTLSIKKIKINSCEHQEYW